MLATRRLNQFVLILGAALILSIGPTSATETWTLLPSAEWSDEFSPMYQDQLGNRFEGNPFAETEDDPSTFERSVWNPMTEDYDTVTFVRNQVLVNFRNTTTSSAITSLLEDLSLTVQRAWFSPNPQDPDTSISWFQLGIPSPSQFYNNESALVTYLTGLPTVDFAEFNDLMDLHTNDEHFQEQGTVIQAFNVDDSWGLLDDYREEENLDTIPPIVVIVFDTGFEIDHPDLDAKVMRHPTDDFQIGFFSTSSGVRGPNMDTDSKIAPLQTGKYDHGHGTCVAGIIAAETNNATGVAGFGPSLQLLNVRLKFSGGSPDTGALAHAIKRVSNYLADEDIDNVLVANISLGGPGKSVGKACVQDTLTRGRLYVASAGQPTNQDDGREVKYYPAAFPEVLGVTGAYTNGERHPSSHFYCGGDDSDVPDLSVYGVSGSYIGIALTTDVHGEGGYNFYSDYAAFSGTSAAAPQVSALAGLLFTKAAIRVESTTPEAVSDAIKKYKLGGEFATSPQFSSTRKKNGQTVTYQKRIPGVPDFASAVSSFLDD